MDDSREKSASLNLKLLKMIGQDKENDITLHQNKNKNAAPTEQANIQNKQKKDFLTTRRTETAEQPYTYIPFDFS